MINLKKYHKQTWSKQKLKNYKLLNKTYTLNFNLKNDLDVLYCEVFQTGLDNKKQLEQAYEMFRKQHSDMWEHMNFKERNFFASKDLETLKSQLKGFDFDSKRIVIPFFEPLLNHLYLDEIPVLELPQFFNLYHDFSKEQIDIKQTYGQKPLKANMSSADYVCGDSCLILYHKQLKTFYRVENMQLESFPLYQKAEINPSLIKDLGQLLKDKNDPDFYQELFTQQLLSKRAVRKYKRKVKVKA